MQAIDIQGVGDVNYVRTGPRGGTPIVFLHGVGLDLTWWGAQFGAFGGDHDIVAIDMPGHGLSKAPSEKPSFAVMIAAILGVLVELEVGPVHLVGVSAGGMIAQMIALHRKDLVRSLTLVATLCTFPDPVRAVLRDRAETARVRGMPTIAALTNARWFPSAFRDARPDILDRATTSLSSQDPVFHGAMWDMIAALNIEAQISAISCPTLVVVGGEDVNAPVAAGERIAALIAHARLVVLPGVGHFPPVERPDVFNALLRRFLTDLNADVAR